MLEGLSPIMHCSVIKADHPQFVNHADGGVKWSVHTWQSGTRAAAASLVWLRSAILVQIEQVTVAHLAGTNNLMWSN